LLSGYLWQKPRGAQYSHILREGQSSRASSTDQGRESEPQLWMGNTICVKGKRKALPGHPMEHQRRTTMIAATTMANTGGYRWHPPYAGLLQSAYLKANCRWPSSIVGYCYLLAEADTDHGLQFPPSTKALCTVRLVKGIPNQLNHKGFQIVCQDIRLGPVQGNTSNTTTCAQKCEIGR